MISLINITKTYNGVKILDLAELIIESSKTTVLIGPSGCGKSTILRLIIGLIQPDGRGAISYNRGNTSYDGEIVFFGQRLDVQNIMKLRHQMGYVIQEGGLFPHLSAKENVMLMARQLGMDKKAMNDRLLFLSELTHFPTGGLERYPHELSGGQRQRVSLMRALMLDPQVLLLDEPLGALDPMIRVELQKDLKSIFNELNKTVLLVTHDMNEAAFFGDTIFLLKDGTVLQQGSINELVNNPKDDFVRNFINAQTGFLLSQLRGID